MYQRQGRAAVAQCHVLRLGPSVVVHAGHLGHGVRGRPGHDGGERGRRAVCRLLGLRGYGARRGRAALPRGVREEPPLVGGGAVHCVLATVGGVGVPVVPHGVGGLPHLYRRRHEAVVERELQADVPADEAHVLGGDMLAGGSVCHAGCKIVKS